jgi:hypothetical protein
MVTNFSNEELIVPTATVLGVVEEMTADVVDRINAGGKERQPTEPLSKERDKRWPVQ